MDSIIDSYVNDSYVKDSYVDDSYVKDSINDDSINDSYVYNTYVKDSFIIDSIIDDSIIDDSFIPSIRPTERDIFVGFRPLESIVGHRIQHPGRRLATVADILLRLDHGRVDRQRSRTMDLGEFVDCDRPGARPVRHTNRTQNPSKIVDATGGKNMAR